MTHECLCILRFSNLCCSIAVILWSGLSEIILSKSSDTRSPMAECQKYQEVPIARTKASQTLHVCELWSCDLLSKFNCHYGIRPRQVFGCPLNGTFIGFDMNFLLLQQTVSNPDKYQLGLSHSGGKETTELCLYFQRAQNCVYVVKEKSTLFMFYVFMSKGRHQ